MSLFDANFQNSNSSRENPNDSSILNPNLNRHFNPSQHQSSSNNPSSSQINAASVNRSTITSPRIENANTSVPEPQPTERVDQKQQPMDMDQNTSTPEILKFIINKLEFGAKYYLKHDIYGALIASTFPNIYSDGNIFDLIKYIRCTNRGGIEIAFKNPNHFEYIYTIATHWNTTVRESWGIHSNAYIFDASDTSELYTRTAVIRDVPISASDDQILQSIKELDGQYSPINARRLTKMGRSLPLLFIYFPNPEECSRFIDEKSMTYNHHFKLRIEPKIRPNPDTISVTPITCPNCMGFEHVLSVCWRKTKCRWCAKPHRTTKCHHRENPSKHQCINCLQNNYPSNHEALSKTCQSYLELKEYLTAKRRDQNPTPPLWYGPSNRQPKYHNHRASTRYTPPPHHHQHKYVPIINPSRNTAHRKWQKKSPSNHRFTEITSQPIDFMTLDGKSIEHESKDTEKSPDTAVSYGSPSPAPVAHHHQYPHNTNKLRTREKYQLHTDVTKLRNAVDQLTQNNNVLHDLVTRMISQQNAMTQSINSLIQHNAALTNALQSQSNSALPSPPQLNSTPMHSSHASHPPQQPPPNITRHHPSQNIDNSQIPRHPSSTQIAPICPSQPTPTVTPGGPIPSSDTTSNNNSDNNINNNDNNMSFPSVRTINKNISTTENQKKRQRQTNTAKSTSKPQNPTKRAKVDTLQQQDINMTPSSQPQQSAIRNVQPQAPIQPQAPTPHTPNTPQIIIHHMNSNIQTSTLPSNQMALFHPMQSSNSSSTTHQESNQQFSDDDL